jgi:hypothetical protein
MLTGSAKMASSHFAPVYLKTGNSALDGHGTRPTPQQVDDIFTQVEIVSEFLDRYSPGRRQSLGRLRHCGQAALAT